MSRGRGIVQHSRGADTRLFLHVKHAELNGYSTFVIHSPDTDVYVMAVAFSAELQGHLYFKTGTGNKSRIISIDDVSSQASIHARKLGVSNEEYKKSVLGVYCFTGCDTVSAFAGKGKLNALKLLQQEREFVVAFSRQGLSWNVDDNLVNELQRFVCRLYGQKQSSVNELRYKMYCSKNGKVKSEQLPPCQNALKQHILRCNYQARIWRLALESNPVKPSMDN